MVELLNEKLLEILACPICKGRLLFVPKQQELWCRVDRLAFPIKHHVPVMLESEARTLTEEERER